MRIQVILDNARSVGIEWPENIPLPSKGDEIKIDRLTAETVTVKSVRFSVSLHSSFEARNIPANVAISIGTN
jgi:hypothetical protein